MVNRNGLALDLADCTEFRQTVAARPPRVVHGAAVLLVALLAAAVAWAALTEADLVVRAAGRVRPVSTPMRVLNAGRGEVLSASSGGRVVEVNFRPGDRVRRGDVLVRLDTERLDNEITRRRRVIQAGEEELARGARLKESLAAQYEAARAKAGAELAQAAEEVTDAKDKQAADVGLCQVELEAARDALARVRVLARNGAAGEEDLVKATARHREATEKLARARLAVGGGRVEVLRRALVLAGHDHAVRCEELATKQAARRGEVDAARVELAGLELERKHADLRAPIDGVVTAGEVKAGDLLEAGKLVAEIAEENGFRFEASVPSEEVGHLRVGMPVRVKLDAYDYQRYGTVSGRVCFISADSGVPEGKPAAVYVVRVELEADEVGRGDLRGRVKLGMAGQAEIVTGRESLLSLLAKKIRQTISLG